MSKDDAAGMPSVRTTELVVAVVLMMLGAVVMWDSVRVGAGWGSDGPKAGYFPFYIGVLIIVGSLVNLARAAASARTRRLFDRKQLGSVLSVLLPAVAFVALIPLVGLYVASILYIGFFMRWLGKFRWRTVAAVSLAVPVAAFLTFEIWFLVALPKGPIEELLGF